MINNLDNSLRLTKHLILFDALFDEFIFNRLKRTRRNVRFTLEKHCRIISSSSFLASLPQSITPSHYESSSAQKSRIAADRSGISSPCKIHFKLQFFVFKFEKSF